jgi:hypothetical protein
VRALGVAYPILTALVVISTANHYLLDVVAAAADVAFAAFIVSRVRLRMRQRSPQNSAAAAGLG